MDEIRQNTTPLSRRIKQHIIGKEHLFYAVVQPGFEETARKELTEMGVDTIADMHEGGFEFRGRLEDCYRVNLSSRALSRVIMRIAKFRAERFNKLFAYIASIPWELYISSGSSMGYNVTSIHSRLYHKGAIEETFHRGIMERLSGHGISVNTGGGQDHLPMRKIFIRFEKNICQVSIDTSGELLYKRGYRKDISEAPLRETLASLILMEAELRDFDILIDPMCGTGTFSIEGAGLLTHSIPGRDREFAFMGWPSFRERAFYHIKSVIEKKNQDQMKKNFHIYSSDNSESNIRAAVENIARSGLGANITIAKADFFRDFRTVPEGKKSLIVINPPYGSRLKHDNLDKFYRKIGNTIRDRYPRSGYAIITPSIEYEKIMSLTYNKKIPFINGGIKVAVIIKNK